MASKESMVTAPLMVMLYDRIFIFGSMKEGWRARWPLYGGLAASWLVLAALAWTTTGYRTAGFSTGVRPWTYLLNQSVIIVEYLRRVAWPRSLVLDYGLPRAVTLEAVMPYAVVVVLLLLLTVAALIRRPKLGFLGAWFFVTLAPTSSILPIATEVGAERRMYLPLAALVVLGVVAANALAQRWSGAAALSAQRWHGTTVPSGMLRWHRASALSGIVLFVAVSGALVAATVMRNREYRSGVSIARTVVERRPHGRAHHLLAVELMKAGQREEALMHLREAVKEDPSAHYSLGVELFNDGKLDQAIGQLSEFVRQAPEVPEKNFVALTNLGIALASTGKADEALSAFRRALDVDPRSADAHRNLAKAFLDNGDFEGAALHARQALEARPGDPEVHNLLGTAFASQRKLDDAIVQFQQALQIDPTNAEAQQNLEQALRERAQTP
jgi:Flp pilus assembly protein TadD